MRNRIKNEFKYILVYSIHHLLLLKTQEKENKLLQDFFDSLKYSLKSGNNP